MLDARVPQVLHQGLLATLYSGGNVASANTTKQAPNATSDAPAGNTTTSSPAWMGQSATADMSSSNYSHEEGAGTSHGNSSSTAPISHVTLPSNIFSQLESEMRHIIAASLTPRANTSSTQQAVVGKVVKGRGAALEPAVKTFAAAAERAVMAAVRGLVDAAANAWHNASLHATEP